MKRSWLVPVSLGAHVFLFGALYAHGIWDIEQLPPAKTSLAGIGVMSPPPPAGGEIKAKPLLIEQKKKLVTETVQPIKKQDLEKLPVKPIAETTGTGNGEGSGTGSGSGTDPNSTGTCTIGPCDGDPPKAEPIPPPPPKPEVKIEKPPIVAPKAFRALWQSGEREIHPPDNVVTQMVRDDHKHVLGTLKVCISATGSVDSAAIAASTGYPIYDSRLLEKVGQWRYHPYEVDGHAVRACSMVTFDYSIK